MKLLVATAGRNFDQALGLQAGQEAFHLGVHLPRLVLEGCLKFREDGLLCSLAVDQVPNDAAGPSKTTGWVASTWSGATRLRRSVQTSATRPPRFQTMASR